MIRSEEQQVMQRETTLPAAANTQLFDIEELQGQVKYLEWPLARAWTVVSGNDRWVK